MSTHFQLDQPAQERRGWRVLAPFGIREYRLLIAANIGRIRAMRMALLAERISATDAHEWGLVTAVREGQLQLLMLNDFREGTRAFQERRTAKFTDS